MTRVGIVDVGVCNLGSLSAALSRLGANPIVLDDAPSLGNVSHLILPGVGGFWEAAKRLRDRGFPESIRASIDSGRPFLGICLGMQLMVETGFEGGQSSGLSVVPGTVSALGPTSEARIPHVGWNSVSLVKRHPVFEGIRDATDFYFAHGYAVSEIPEDNVVGLTEHGTKFPSSISSGSAVGVQFHPEKSQSAGSLLLSNFLAWDGKC